MPHWLSTTMANQACTGYTAIQPTCIAESIDGHKRHTSYVSDTCVHTLNAPPCTSRRRGTSGWKCEEWLDWMETVAPLALLDAEWPEGPGCDVKAVFDDMVSNLRNFTLHYLRGSLERVGKQATEAARMWAFNYGETADAVRPPHQVL